VCWAEERKLKAGGFFVNAFGGESEPRRPLSLDHRPRQRQRHSPSATDREVVAFVPEFRWRRFCPEDGSEAIEDTVFE